MKSKHRPKPAATPDSHSKIGKEARQEHEMELLVGYLLLSGVVLSIILVLTGMIWEYVKTGSLHLNYLIAGMNFFQFLVGDVRAILTPALIGPRAFVNLGIAVLIFTPYIRVVSSMVFFAAAEKNWKYTAFTAFVGVVLTYSLFLR
ncbi:MAG: DUF1634 domain-containing protein [Gammaproteobacteria bacterium]